MKIKLKPWDKVVSLSKKYRDFTEYDDGSVAAFGLTANDLPWGQCTELIEVDTDGDYFVLNASGDNCWFVHPYMTEQDSSISDNLLRYGEVVTDDAYASVVTEFGNRQAVRIRLISYGGMIWYHKMVEGDVVECRKVGRADG